MKEHGANEVVLRALEERLLEAELRTAPEQVAELLADEFIEIGSSGRVFDKQEIVEALWDEGRADPLPARTIADFRVRPLADGLVLVTYRATRRSSIAEEERQTLRSSIWRLIETRWQMIFHQGTLASVPTSRP